jgi:hypothetical protein
VDISKGKQVRIKILFIKVSVSKKNHSISAPKSLNYLQKKKEAERIDFEN